MIDLQSKLGPILLYMGEKGKIKGKRKGEREERRKGEKGERKRGEKLPRRRLKVRKFAEAMANLFSFFSFF